jgi:D-lyxose ketol-isomerase
VHATAARERAAAMLADAGIVLTPAEREAIEVADFGLGELERYGLQIVVYVNTDRVCAKELVLHPADQHTIPPDTLHWFEAGDEGAIVSEFSTHSRDDADVFTDLRIVR